MDITTRGSVMITTVILVLVYWLIVSIAAIIGEKAGNNIKRHRIVQRVSLVCWLPIGIFPGVNGFGVQYMLLVTVLPLISIYYLFEWQRTIVMNNWAKDLKKQ